MNVRRYGRQRGVAVVTALLLTTLAITIVASLFWQQQVQVRSIENQRLQLQKQWILRGALDWSRLILREDKRISPTVDHLGEPWAAPLADTRLDEYVDKDNPDPDAQDAVLSGSIEDAQARFNLTNLCCKTTGGPDDDEVNAFAKLLTNVRQNPALAKATAQMMATTQAKSLGAGGQTNQMMSIQQIDDLLAVPGFTPAALAAIKDFVVVLPPSVKTINLNTASAEVLSARIATLPLSQANTIVSARKTVWYKDRADFGTQTGVDPGSAVPKVDVKTDWFLVNGNVRLRRAGIQTQALVDRTTNNPKVVWIRQN